MKRWKIFSLPFLLLNSYSYQFVSAQPSTIPYEGVLEHNGAPVTGAVNLTFFLVGERDVQVQNQNSNGVLWWEEHSATPPNRPVQVSAGAFAVELGKHTAFGPDFFSTNPTLYLGMMIQLEQNGAWRELGGPAARQLLLPTPFAMHAREANNFTVRGRLRVQNAAIIRGAQSSGSESNGTLVLETIDTNERMVLDGSEIDTRGTLNIQTNPTGEENAENRQNTVIGGGLEVQGQQYQGGNSPALLTLNTHGSNAKMRLDGNSLNANTVLHIQTKGADNPADRFKTIIGGDLEVQGRFLNALTVETQTANGEPMEVELEGGRANDENLQDLTETTLQLGPRSDRACFFSKSTIGQCEVLQNNTHWILKASRTEARLVIGEGWIHTPVYCKAMCIAW